MRMQRGDEAAALARPTVALQPGEPGRRALPGFLRSASWRGRLPGRALPRGERAAEGRRAPHVEAALLQVTDQGVKAGVLREDHALGVPIPGEVFAQVEGDVKVQSVL